MRLVHLTTAITAVSCYRGVTGQSPTDEYRDADPAQSGYLPNHNVDPAIVDGPSFGQLWKISFNAQEQFYAKPLIYTPKNGGPQLVFLASTQNYIRTVNAVSGVAINSRQVAAPFLMSDIPNCNDITSSTGITGTPVIDPATDIAYFYVKTYIPGYRAPGNTGMENGVYYFYAVDVNTLEDISGFPILLDGNSAQNDPRRYFVGGIALQRPSLTQIGSFVYAGFGSHCDFYNYTGYLVGVDVTKAQVVTIFATQGPNGAFSGNYEESSGGSAIWMGGAGLSTDGNRIFYVTGNGFEQSNNDSLTDSSGWQDLAESVVDMSIDANGVVSVSDFFMPYNYLQLDKGDADLGSSGLALLDPSTFKGPGISKMAVTAGKSGVVYVLNADNLGGFKQGPGGTDSVIQIIGSMGPIFGGIGSYPLEGGFIYITTECAPTYVYSLGLATTGQPVFSQVAKTDETFVCGVGPGIPTVTTFQGQTGTAILWVTDPSAGLRAWHAVPDSGGNMQTIKLPQTPGMNKWARPAFGDGRVYVIDISGTLYCLGAPVALPLNCTLPIQFGNVAIGSNATVTVSCTAVIAITSINGATVGDPSFIVDNATLPKGSLKPGDTFSFPVNWDLTAGTTGGLPSSSDPRFSPGIKNTPLTILTTNGVPGYTTAFPISLMGNEVSPNGLIQVSPLVVIFNQVDTSTAGSSSTSSFTIKNAGLSPMEILGYAYSSGNTSSTGSPGFTNVSLINGHWDLGPGFTTDHLPPLSPDISNNAAVTVSCLFTPINGTGAYSSHLTIWTSGGQATILLSGSAAPGAIGILTISNGQGDFLPNTTDLMDFGTVAPGSSESRQAKLCNIGGTVLTITKSKPPEGLIHVGNQEQLHEGQQIPSNSCATGDIFLQPPEGTPNSVVNATWIINCDYLKFGVHTIQINGIVVSSTTSASIASQPSSESTPSSSRHDSSAPLFPRGDILGQYILLIPIVYYVLGVYN